MPLGDAVPMLDAALRVTGAVEYLANLALDGMLVGKVVRSTVAHGRVVAVDASRARRVPGVRAVLTRDELGAHARIGGNPTGQTVLATDRVRFAGEPVAAVAADSFAAAAEAASLVRVEVEPLPVVLDAVAARGGAVVLHDDKPDNVYAHATLRHGDLDAGFAAADHVFEDEFTSPTAQTTSLEPHGAIAKWHGDRLTIWASTQAPYLLRMALAKTFAVEESGVRVIVPPLGGGYGGKSGTFLEPLVCALARLCGNRPVKVLLARREEFATVVKHAAHIRIKTGVRKDGTLTARQVIAHWNGGAWATASQMLVRSALVRLVGPYRIPEVHVDAYGVFTNLPPSGSYRGAMQSQSTWAYESQMDMIARRIGMDPVQLRLKNVLRNGDVFATGERMHDVHFVACIEAAAKGLGPRVPVEKGARPRGRGVAVMMKNPIGTSRSEARIRYATGEGFTLFVSTVEMGQGAHTALAQIAADALGVAPASIRVVGPDTDRTPYDAITVASRSTEMMGRAVADAAAKWRAAMKALAEKANDADWDAAVTQSGRTALEAMGEHSTQYQLDPKTGQGVTAADWHQGAGAVEVEVDRETGEYRITKYHAVSWAGTVVNRRGVRLQNEGNVIFGYGPTRMEEVVYGSDGRPLDTNLYDWRGYHIPSIRDVDFALGSEALEAPGAAPSGVGEMTLPPVAPAVAAALEDAVGVRIRELPITADKILRALDEEKPT